MYIHVLYTIFYVHVYVRNAGPQKSVIYLVFNLDTQSITPPQSWSQKMNLKSIV